MKQNKLAYQCFLEIFKILITRIGKKISSYDFWAIKIYIYNKIISPNKIYKSYDWPLKDFLVRYLLSFRRVAIYNITYSTWIGSCFMRLLRRLSWKSTYLTSRKKKKADNWVEIEFRFSSIVRNVLETINNSIT